MRTSIRGGRALLGALLLSAACHALRPPARPAPPLSTGVHTRMLRAGGMDRRYLVYVPERRAAKPPLLVLMHGSRQTPEDLRKVTNYAFDRLADEQGFVAVYPEAYKRRWNDCRAAGRYAARRLQLDDVSFLLALVDRLADSLDIDRTRVFFLGYSGGGQLAFRIALERPERATAVAAFAANLPTPANFACHAAGKPVPVLLVNGTEDRINPFVGGKVRVFGFASRGAVRSALASASYFAALAGLTRSELRRSPEASGTWLEERRWHAPGAAEVVLLAVHGGGHVIPGPGAAFPGVLGKISPALDGPREAWQFFARQRPLSAP